MLRPFTLDRPSTLGEVADLLTAHPHESVLYAGGTELLLLMKEGLIRPRRLIDVKTVRDLDAVNAENGTLTIGATVRHRGLERSALVQERCPLVAGVARHVANVRVRDGTLHLWSRRGARDVPLADFIRGPYETAREEDEVLTSVRLRPWPAKTASAYLKFGVYERPTLGVAVACGPDALRVTVGCVGPRPQRLFEVEGKATGEPAAVLLARAEELGAAAALEVEAVGDRHGSAEYKRALTGACVKRALQVAAARAQGQQIHTRYAHTVIV